MEEACNIFNEKFEISFTYDDPTKQRKCNELVRKYLANPSEFNLHRFFQDLFQATVDAIDFDEFES